MISYIMYIYYKYLYIHCTTHYTQHNYTYRRVHLEAWNKLAKLYGVNGPVIAVVSVVE